MLGSCPRDQAGKATEARCDFRWRGGTLTISRWIRPSRTAASPDGRPPAFAWAKLLRAVPGIAGHDLYMLVHREAGARVELAKTPRRKANKIDPRAALSVPPGRSRRNAVDRPGWRPDGKKSTDGTRPESYSRWPRLWQRASDFPKATPSGPGEARRRLLLQEGSLRRKARITLLNFSGLCSGAKWLTPGSRMNSAPECYGQGTRRVRV
jgi:hypothetical protein